MTQLLYKIDRPTGIVAWQHVLRVAIDDIVAN